jgi:hypothetical protein
MIMELVVNQPRSHRERLWLVLAIFAYVCCFHLVYVYYLNREVVYFGFVYEPAALRYVALGWTLSVLPSFWMPLRLARPSQLAYWILYVVVLIPSMLVPVYVNLVESGETIMLMLTLFVGFIIVGLSHLVPLLRVRSKSLTAPFFKWLIGACLLLSAAWVLYVFRGALSLVSFQSVYDVRFNAEDVMEGSHVSYAAMLLSGALDPFLMGWGLYSKRPLLFIAGALGQLLVYASWGTKGSFSSILFVGAFYLLIRSNRRPFALKLMGCLVAVFFAVAGLYLAGGSKPGAIFSFALFFLFVRIFSVQGLLSAQYYDFFKHNPLTHYSSVNVIGWFIHYPYAHPVGIEVGYSVTGDPLYDAVAHFWAYDGIAAWGLPGILVISIVCALVFWLLDSAAQRHDPRFAGLVTCYAAYNLANISLFTSLLSGGLWAIMLLLYLMPAKAAVPSLRRLRQSSLPNLHPGLRGLSSLPATEGL